MRPTAPHSPRTARAFGLVCAALCALMVPTEARADDLKTKELSCKQGAPGQVVCSLDLRGFFDASIRGKLGSGLLNRFLYRIYIRRVSDGEPVALAAMRLVEVYELWDDIYYVFKQDGGETTRQSSTLDEAVANLAALDALIVAEGLPPGRYYADLFLELNPLSEEEEAELRSWIARSRGGHRTFATGDRSFFGTFVSLFINIKPGKAERTFRIQTAPFRVGGGKP